MEKIRMDPKIQSIIKEIDALNDALGREYSRLADKYGFRVNREKVVFSKNSAEKNRAFCIPAWKYAIPTSFRHALSIPFIYMMIIPTVMLDVFITVYQWTAFSLYRIPKVKRGDHLIYDRRFLDYLNVVQKVNCLYCSYVNGLFSYSSEIAARTERYWCPIKAANNPKSYHGWYGDFADYGNPEEWKKKINDAEAFKKQGDVSAGQKTD